MDEKVLGGRFYQRATVEVARDLLGKVLVRRTRRGEICGRIVETEAYDGPEDLACHSSVGKTKRTEVMFGPAGHAYVYLIYGVYHCLNVVTEKPGAAVLIRALEPLGSVENKKIASGPGKLCQWMQIDKKLNGWDLTRGRRLWIADGDSSKLEIASSPRIGVDYAGEWAKKPWRFFIRDHQGSKKTRRVPFK
jgi:DNA-3-methyladenine glycosylase